MNETVVVIVRGIIAFFSLLIFARFLGKQQISQLTFFDYVLGITIGSIAASLTTAIIRVQIENEERPMRRFVFYLIPTLTLALFIVVMNGGIYLKNTVGEKDHHFTKYYGKIRADIKDEQWEQAIKNFKGLEGVWKKKIPRIQFSVERDQINGIDVSLARLQGYLEAEDKAGSLAELYEAKRHWDDLGR